MTTAIQNTTIARKGGDLEVNNVAISGVLEVGGEAVKAGQSVQTLTASGAITLNSGLVELNHATVVIAATLDAPTAGDELFIVDSSASGTAAHTVTLPSGVTWDGTNRVATLNAPGEALHVIALSATRFYIVQNNGSVNLVNVGIGSQRCVAIEQNIINLL